MTSSSLDGRQEVYVSRCCGATFIPGHGPDDIAEYPHYSFDAQRGGDCPACGAEEPLMQHATDVYPPFDPEEYSQSDETLWSWLSDFAYTMVLLSVALYLVSKALGARR